MLATARGSEPLLRPNYGWKEVSLYPSPVIACRELPTPVCVNLTCARITTFARGFIARGNGKRICRKCIRFSIITGTPPSVRPPGIFAPHLYSFLGRFERYISGFFKKNIFEKIKKVQILKVSVYLSSKTYIKSARKSTYPSQLFFLRFFGEIEESWVIPHFARFVQMGSDFFG